MRVNRTFSLDAVLARRIKLLANISQHTQTSLIEEGIKWVLQNPPANEICTTCNKKKCFGEFTHFKGEEKVK